MAGERRTESSVHESTYSNLRRIGLALEPKRRGSARKRVWARIARSLGR